MDDRELARHHEHDPVADRDGVVGDPLVVAAQQGDVDRGLDAVRPVVGEQLGEAGAAQHVHLVVVAAQHDRGVDVALGDDLGDPGDHVLGDLGHPRDGGAYLLGHGDPGDAQPGDLGDVHGEVAHPLELADHPQRGHDHAQVAGHGLLEREQREAVVLDPPGGLVDGGVRADDVLGLLGVAGQERLGGQPYGPLHVAAHEGEVAEDGVELVMESLTHGRDSTGAG